MTVTMAALALMTLGSMTSTDSIDTLMQPYSGNVPGASVLVIQHGKPVVRRSYGLADVDSGTAATPATSYRLASVTKQFTAASILLLAQDGKLSIDDHVKKWLPSLPPALDPVTIEQLLTHTSGIIDYEDVIPEGTTEQVHDADVLRLLESQDSVYFRPGTSYRYSNSGYSLLALIVEKASGKRFAAFLHDRIFAPLGMSHTVAYEKGISTVATRAYGFKLEDGRWVRHDQSVTSAVLGDGGIYSSIDDMARWDAALYDSRLLSDRSREMAFSPHVRTSDPAVAYGFGWRISGDAVWHSGETAGFMNVIVRYPAQHLTVVVLTNRDEPGPYGTALKIAKLYQ